MKIEADKVKMHNSFMETKGKSMKALSDSTTEKKIALAETTAKQAGTKRKIGKLADEVTTLQKAATKTTATCSEAANEWTTRQADRTKEKAALNEAIRYLTESSFEQLSLVQESNEDNDEEEHASVVFATSFLQTDSDSKSSSDSKFADNAFYAAAEKQLSGEDSEDDEIEGHLRKDT